MCIARQSLWMERQHSIGNSGTDGILRTHRKLQNASTILQDQKTIENPPEQWKIFRNTHEAIVDEETFERVQELRRNKRRPAKMGKSNLFSGVAYCADCGEKLYYCTTQNFEERQDHFVCSTSRKKGKDVCGTHFIRAMVLEKGVLKFLQILLWYISDCEDLFREKLGAKRKEEFKKSWLQNADSLHRHSAGSRNSTDCSNGFMKTISRVRSMTAVFKSYPLTTKTSKKN